MSRQDRPLRPLWHLLPSGYAVPFVALGTAWLLLFGSCSGVLTASKVASGTATLGDLTSLGIILGFVLLPVSAVLLFVSAVLAGRWAARGALFAVSLVTMLLGWGALLMSGLGDDDPLGSAVFASILYAVPIGVATLAFVVSTLLGVRDVRAGIAQARRERVVELVTSRGELDYETVASEVRIRREATSRYLESLVEGGELQAVLDPEVEMVFSPDRHQQKQRDVVSVAWGRGKADLSDIASELRLSPARVREMLIAGMMSGAFSGFWDAKTGEVVSSAAAALRHGTSCPSCGGQMDLAGHGVVVCRYCRAEVFLPAD